jgi:hypothetical protein
MKRNKPDANQPKIVQALRDIGARVFLIGRPLDLLIAFRGKLILMEVKNPDGEDKVSKSQQVTIDLLESVGVHVQVVRSKEEATECLYNM